MFNAQRVEQKQDKQPTSNFLMTINTNNSSLEHRDKVDFVTKTILNHFDKFLIPKQEAYGIKLENNIISTKVKYSIEQNSLGAFHSHSLIEIKQKKGYYHVNLPKLREALYSQFGYNPHLDIKYYKNSSEAVEAYISKKQR